METFSSFDCKQKRKSVLYKIATFISTNPKVSKRNRKYLKREEEKKTNFQNIFNDRISKMHFPFLT